MASQVDYKSASLLRVVSSAQTSTSSTRLRVRCLVCSKTAAGAHDDRAEYPVGYGVSVALLGTAVILSTVNLVICKRLNAQREAMSEADVRAKYTQDELDDMADASPLFRYEH